MKLYDLIAKFRNLSMNKCTPNKKARQTVTDFLLNPFKRKSFQTEMPLKISRADKGIMQTKTNIFKHCFNFANILFV